MIGVSKGADIALAMATFIPEVKAAVWINGCISSIDSSLIVKDTIIEGLRYDPNKIKVQVYSKN